MTIQGFFFFKSHFHIKLPWRPLKNSTSIEEQDTLYLLPCSQKLGMMKLNARRNVLQRMIIIERNIENSTVKQRVASPTNGMRPTNEG